MQLKILGISFTEHITNEEVRMRITQQWGHLEIIIIIIIIIIITIIIIIIIIITFKGAIRDFDNLLTAP